MNKNNIKSAVETALVADSYLLGAHWIYDAEELKNLDMDWNTLNAPKAPWHKGKDVGDFTHYGDHAKWLEYSVAQNNCFDLASYRSL